MAPIYSRRQALKSTSAGFGYVALAGLLGQRSNAADAPKPLAPKPPHFEPKAKRVIFVFLQGAISQMDTFEYKPQLQRDGGKPGPGGGTLTASRYKFQQYGQTGSWFSELLPNSPPTPTSSAGCGGCTPTPPPTRRRSCNCTPAAPTPPSPGRAWGRGCCTAWAPRTRSCRGM